MQTVRNRLIIWNRVVFCNAAIVFVALGMILSPVWLKYYKLGWITVFVVKEWQGSDECVTEAEGSDPGDRTAYLWGLVPPLRQEPGQGKGEGSEQSEMGTQDKSEVEEEEVQMRCGPVESPPSPTPLSPRTRSDLKKKVQR